MFSTTIRLALTIAFGAVSPMLSAEQPNIVLILADDLGINDLSCYGRKDQPTPNLDRLASEGVRFTSGYCAQSICSASRAALMTGKAPARLHLTTFLPGRPDTIAQRLAQPVIEGQLPLEEITLAERLRERGYATGHIGKWHLGGAGFGPTQQGFEYSYAGKANTTPSATEGSKGEYDLTARAEEWLDQHKAGPFFLYLAHNTPHIPFAALPSDLAKHERAFHPGYASVIEHLDRCIARIMAKIDGLGLRENTILIFTSDNGGLHVLEFPGTPATHHTPFRAGKGYVYEGGLRVPLIIRWPGVVQSGTVSDTPVVLTDLVPTLLEAVGIDLAKEVGPFDGTSLTRFLAGAELHPRPLFWHFPHYTNQGGRPAGAIRDADWKLVEQYEDGKLELYNLAVDPGESKDLSQEQSARAAEMQEKLLSWRESLGAQDCGLNSSADLGLHARLYHERDSSKIAPAATAQEVERAWSDWRKTMNDVAKGQARRVTPATGDIRLLARNARVHGEKLRYEPQPQKETLGFWVRPEDWVSWEFEVPASGEYEIEILQGCGNAGGAEVDLEIGDQKIPFTVTATGHFQNFAQRTIGTVHLAAGKQTLAVKPRTKPGNAVMDLRRVVLRPAR